MLAPRYVIFTAVEGALLDPASRSWSAAVETLAELERRHVALVLSTTGTRAQIEPLRAKLEHTHPFITESGGAIFFPDGYFSLPLEGVKRVARYLCVPFGKPYAEVASALDEIAQKARAAVVGYSQMSARDIARNTGEALREAELAKQREFSELFFFAGETKGATARFERAAAKAHWEFVPGDPFWELRSGNSAARAITYLMRIYRTATRSRLNSVAIGSAAADLSLLSAADHPIVLPLHGGKFEASIQARLPGAEHGETSGPVGWSQAVLKLL